MAGPRRAPEGGPPGPAVPASPTGARRRPPLRRASAALLLMAVPLVGEPRCAESAGPVLGGLQLDRSDAAFHMPVRANDRLPFEYPRREWERGVGGETLLRIHITTAGTVDSVAVLRTSGHPSLDSAAVAGARRLRYRPARRGGMPVAVWATLPVRYPQPERSRSP